MLLDGLEDRTTREWYAVRAGGWTRNVLQRHIATRLHEREGAVLSNFDIGEGSEFRLDLLFYHHPTSLWVVIDLKTGPFRAEYTGKMNAYVNAVDELVARGGDKPTVGFILCAEHRRAEARFALRGMATPLAVGRYVTGERGVETADEPAGISDGLEGELVRLARVEQRLARFAAERAAVLGAGTDRGG